MVGRSSPKEDDDTGGDGVRMREHRLYCTWSVGDSTSVVNMDRMHSTARGVLYFYVSSEGYIGYYPLITRFTALVFSLFLCMYFRTIFPFLEFNHSGALHWVLRV